MAKKPMQLQIMLHADRVDDNANSEHQHWWNIFQPILDLVIPCCICPPLLFFSLHTLPPTPTVTGTIICPTNDDRVKISMQIHAQTSPFITLELPLPTSHFAGLIRAETNRVVFSCCHEPGSLRGPLLSASTWAMLFNGKKMGFAVRREVTEKDASLLEMIRTVSAGAGLMPDKDGCGEHKYLRGQFARMVGSDDGEAYHLIDPSGCFGQELSLFFLRN